jgi:hypothetical protein
MSNEQVNVDGYIDTLGTVYLGVATKQEDGTWQCLANVAGALCLVEVKITPKMPLSPIMDNR